ncbi:MAG: preprotein translocase subunit YajC [Dysgonamonadaceae bacterium]|jgi:preprotein translocase subunit YajC|nr:preprotein translocase subunit YajC [Dysgonamonadaceae bacterium]
MTNLFILLQDPAPASSGGLGGILGSPLIMIILLFAIMYFLMIRPQQKKQKAIQKMRESLTIGDKVVTAGGIYGKIKETGEKTFIIEISDGVRIKVDKASVYASSDDIQVAK